MNVKQYYEITYTDKIGNFKSIICTSYSIFRETIIIYDESFKEKVIEHNSKRITIKVNVIINNVKRISDESYIFFN